MAVSARVIPCLDVADGRVVKGVNFKNLQDAGDPVELGAKYAASGADELTFLDVTASSRGRETTYEIVRRTAENVFIPLTVGGGVRSVSDVAQLLTCGADKIGINSAAIVRPQLISEIADRFGNQVVVLSLDMKRSTKTPSGYVVTTHGGRTETELDGLAWVVEATRRGAGEILINSMDADGTKAGFDLEMISAVRELTGLPLIASGGAGKSSDFAPAISAGADAVLAASVFHHDILSIAEVKTAMSAAGVKVRAA